MQAFFNRLKIKRWKVFIVGKWEFVSGRVNFKDREPVVYPSFKEKLCFQFFADGSYRIFLMDGDMLMPKPAR